MIRRSKPTLGLHPTLVAGQRTNCQVLSIGESEQQGASDVLRLPFAIPLFHPSLSPLHCAGAPVGEAQPRRSVNFKG